MPDRLISVRNGIDKPGQVAITLPVCSPTWCPVTSTRWTPRTDIDAAAAALPAADAGDGDAKFVVDSAEGHELLWYATQELIYLIG